MLKNGRQPDLVLDDNYLELDRFRRPYLWERTP